MKKLEKNPARVRYIHRRKRNGVVYEVCNLFTVHEMKCRCTIARTIKETRNYLRRTIEELEAIYAQEAKEYNRKKFELMSEPFLEAA
jgi:hypothetical protein